MGTKLLWSQHATPETKTTHGVISALSELLLFELSPSLVPMSTPQLLLLVEQGWQEELVSWESSQFKGWVKSDEGGLPPSSLAGPVYHVLWPIFRLVHCAVVRAWHLGHHH